MLLRKDRDPLRAQNLVHAGFRLTVLLKGADSLLEIVGGFLLMYLNPRRVNTLAFLLTRHELSEDPNDGLANLLLQLSRGFSIGAQSFGVIYLLSHGLIKLLLVLLLLRGKRWAYPLTMVSLLLFIAYQIYRYTISHSVFLLLLTAFDLLMTVLTDLEYERLKARG